jgi:hypothetical protein
MPIRFRCPHCQAALERQPGATMRCPFCRNVIRAPPAPPQPPTVDYEPPEGTTLLLPSNDQPATTTWHPTAPAAAPEEAAAVEPPARKKHRPVKALLWAAGVLAALLLVVTLTGRRAGAPPAKGEESAVRALVDTACNGPTAAAREEALDSLKRADPELHREVATLLADDGPGPIRQAVEKIKGMGGRGKAAVPALAYCYTRARRDGKPQLEQASALPVALAAELDPGDKAVQEAVVGLMTSLYPLANAEGVKIMDGMKAEPSVKVPPLVKALEKPFVRAAAAKALGNVGPEAKDALPALTKSMLHPDPAVRDAVSAAGGTMER